jgi:hypothetical protein
MRRDRTARSATGGLTLDAIFPALLFLAFWYGQAGLVFLFLGFETKGRSIEEIGSALDAPASSPLGRPLRGMRTRSRGQG